MRPISRVRSDLSRALAELKPSSQEVLKDQYQRARVQHQMVVFGRDNEARRLVSYALDLEGAPEE